MSDAVSDALAYLQSNHVMTLATQGPGGVWAAAVFYASAEFELYFLSAASTRHVMNLQHQPRCAATIQRDYQDWREIRGIQLEGVAQQLTGAKREQAIALYHKKFPFLNQAPKPVRRALEQVDWFQLAPDHLYYIDNRRGFGYRERLL